MRAGGLSTSPSRAPGVLGQEVDHGLLAKPGQRPGYRVTGHAFQSSADLAGSGGLAWVGSGFDRTLHQV